MSGTLLSRISQSPFAQNSYLTEAQAQVDELVGGFVQQATDWRSMAAMMAGGVAYRLGRVGAMGTGTGRILSAGIGLGAEVTVFEMTHRSLSSLTGEAPNSNLWKWKGQGGIRQGLLSSLVTFGTLKGAARLAQGENIVIQHLLQDTGMVLGHQISGVFGITEKSKGTLAEQFLHAEVTNLQLGAGMSLAHSMAPGIQGLERGLDLSLRSIPSFLPPLLNRNLIRKFKPAFAFSGTAKETPALSGSPSTETTHSRSIGGSLPKESRNSSVDETVLQRAILKAKDEMYFQYGRISPHHPAQIFVNGLAEKIPVKEGLKPTFIVLPEWKRVNASALPDGTIFLSHGLLESGTVEALLGVMAHEYVHTYRRHALKRVAKRNVDFVERVLGAIGLTRIHEYEADLRGTMELLEEMGVNPIPFKALLEEFYQKEVARRELGLRGGEGIVHGSSLDRALNIISLTYFIDLKGLESQDRTPIPQEIRHPPSQIGAVVSFKAVHQNSDLFNGKKERIQSKKEARSQIIETLTLPELALSIQAIASQIKSQKAHKKSPDLDDSMALEKALDRFHRLSLGEEGDPTKKEIKKALHLALFAGLQFEEARMDQVVRTEADLEALRTLLYNFPESAPFRYVASASGSTLLFWRNLLSLVVESRIFMNGTTQGLERGPFNHFLENWPSTLSKISERYDTGQVWSARDYLNSALEVSFLHDLLQRNHSIYTKEIEKALKEQAENFPQREEIERLAKSLLSLDLENVRRMIPGVGKRLLKLLGKEAGLPELRKALRSFQRIMAEASHHSIVKKYETSEIYSFKSNFSVTALLRFCLDHGEKLQSIPERQKAMMVFSTAYRMGMADSEWLWDHSSWKTIQVLEDLIDESRLYEPPLEADDVLMAYHYLFDDKFYHEILGLSVEESHYGGKVVARSFAVNFLAGQPLQKIPDLLDSWSQKGADVEGMIASNPTSAGPLGIKLAKAIQSGEVFNLPLPVLLRMGEWIPNPFLRAVYQRFVKDYHWNSLGFDERLDVIFPLAGGKGIRDTASINEFIEGDIKTREDYRKVLHRFRASTDAVTEEGSAQAGLAVIADINMQYRDGVAFLKSLLTTGRSDRELKEKAYELLDMNLGEEAIFDRIGLADEVVRLLFSLDSLGKQLLLRKLLIGAGGALHPQNRGRFLAMLFQEWITEDASQQDLSQVLKTVQLGLVGAKEWEPLYFALQSVLLDQIAIPPDQKAVTPWTDIYRIQEDLEAVGDLHAGLKKVRGILWKKVPACASQRPWEHMEGFRGLADRRLQQVLEKKTSGPSPSRQPMTPLRFVKDVGSRMGSLGVRFLQLLPLIVDLKPKYVEEFAEIYDRVKGQSKLSALYLLEREWPEFWDVIAEVGDRIGGGSVATVYGSLTQEGEKEVLKVRNPNIAYHLEETYKFAALVLDDLAKRHSNIPAYRSARLLLDDILAWIKADVSFEGFLEKDFEFKEWAEKAGISSGRYQIYIPKSKGPPSAYFAREEYVEATNLTRWDELKKRGHDLRSIVSLAVKFYLAQIANGRALSDVHIGNLAVTENGRLVIYDRNYYLDLSSAERDLVRHFLVPGAKTEEQVEALAHYLDFGQGEQGSVQRRQMEAVVAALQKQDWHEAQSVLIQLKQEGVKFPLQFTLLLKNFQSLQRMASKAGFRNLFEAATY